MSAARVKCHSAAASTVSRPCVIGVEPRSGSTRGSAYAAGGSRQSYCRGVRDASLRQIRRYLDNRRGSRGCSADATRIHRGGQPIVIWARPHGGGGMVLGSCLCGGGVRDRGATLADPAQPRAAMPEDLDARVRQRVPAGIPRERRHALRSHTAAPHTTPTAGATMKISMSSNIHDGGTL